jgi:molybdopterin-guanine dinucleotide biosynthesis protein B
MSKFKKLAVAFTGPSNSGKTTIIEKIAKILIAKDFKVTIIKNDPKDKAVFDYPKKDSFRFSATGADVIVTSPTRTTFFSKEHREFSELVKLAGDFDYLLVEGLKNLPLPRIGVFRNKIDLDYIPVLQSLAIDNTINLKDYELPQNLTILDLNNPQEVLDWIEKNGKKF